MEVLEAINKWSKAFGGKSVAIVETTEPDEENEQVASFILRPSIREFAEHFDVDEQKIAPIVIRRAASECLVALLRAGHENVTASVQGDVLYLITDKEEQFANGFTLV